MPESIINDITGEIIPRSELDNRYEIGVTTKPVKQFFVDMLTRDIAVEDAILDLLDNCIDGVIRSIDPDAVNDLNPARPYQGFHAKITVQPNLFRIEDNCGGIPWDEHDRAFRMGRPAYPVDAAPNEAKPSVGVYGIGMKRAIFKMGGQARIVTRNGSDRYEVPISSDWMQDQDSWDLRVLDRRDTPSELNQEGTLIEISQLHEGISERFGGDSYKDDLLDKIQSHYAVIIGKGFDVTVNGTPASPKPVRLHFSTTDQDSGNIRPYVFTTERDGVEIFVTVGLRSPVPSEEDVLEEQVENRYSTDEAGWTVICNDRVVLYCNKDELTGWGTAGVPRYHTQFIAISGVVEFHGDPRLLPTTTTKRGLDFSSSLYQQVLDRMRDGIKIFTSYTNKWKAREEEAKAQVGPVPTMGFSELKEQARAQLGGIKLSDVKIGMAGKQYKPKLPVPINERTDVRIVFHRDAEAVRILGDKILNNSEGIKAKDVPRTVGERAFDLAFSQYVTSKADELVAGDT